MLGEDGAQGAALGQLKAAQFLALRSDYRVFAG